MRIVGGRHKGARLHAPSDGAVRPTSDRVREALFNILEHGHRSCQDARVLDLFAGTGALGLEALSRGARHVLFVDDAASSRGLVRRNAEQLNGLGSVRIMRRDATRLGAMPANAQGPFDIVFADPPYGKGLGERALRAALEGGWLAPDAVIILEEAATSQVDVPDGFTQCERRLYGSTQVLFLSLAK